MPPKRDNPSLKESMASIADSLSKLLAGQTELTTLVANQPATVNKLDHLTNHLTAVVTKLEKQPLIGQETPPPPPPPPPPPAHKSPKVLLPTFDGSLPLDWLFQADHYFSFYNIPSDQRVTLASFHFQGDALSWYKYMHNNQLVGDWPSFARALELRFGPSSFENHQATLFKLKQTGSVATYQTEFEKLSNCVVGLPQVALLNCFISGLRIDIQQELAIHHPTSLHQAYGLAKLVEDKLSASHSRFLPSSRPSPYTPVVTPRNPTTPVAPALLPSPPKQPTTLPLRRLTPAEVQARRSQGLCFRCPEKFHPGHRCNPPQFLLLETNEPLPMALEVAPETSNPNDPDPEQGLDDMPTTQFLALSPAALHGTASPDSIRLTGYISGHPVTVLVDTGSTHNIVQTRVASFLHLPTNNQPSFPVMVGNGSFIHCTGQCTEVKLRLADAVFSISPFILPIEGTDIVLGMSWLSRLGPVIADFSIPKLTFEHNQ